jgi:hypothetical protein
MSIVTITCRTQRQVWRSGNLLTDCKTASIEMCVILRADPRTKGNVLAHIRQNNYLIFLLISLVNHFLKQDFIFLFRVRFTYLFQEYFLNLWKNNLEKYSWNKKISWNKKEISWFKICFWFSYFKINIFWGVSIWCSMATILRVTKNPRIWDWLEFVRCYMKIRRILAYITELQNTFQSQITI